LTGVCLYDGSETRSAVEITEVEFLDLSDEEIEQYVAGGEPLDKAGAYGIQGEASKFVKRVNGCYFNVVGLPLARVYGFIRSILR
jgi:septum formation protein